MNYVKIYDNNGEFFNEQNIILEGFFTKNQTKKLLEFCYKQNIDISIATCNNNEQEDKNLNIKSIIEICLKKINYKKENKKQQYKQCYCCLYANCIHRYTNSKKYPIELNLYCKKHKKIVELEETCKNWKLDKIK